MFTKRPKNSSQHQTKCSDHLEERCSDPFLIQGGRRVDVLTQADESPRCLFNSKFNKVSPCRFSDRTLYLGSGPEPPEHGYNQNLTVANMYSGGSVGMNTKRSQNTVDPADSPQSPDDLPSCPPSLTADVRSFLPGNSCSGVQVTCPHTGSLWMTCVCRAP